jgi:predicted SnoaL-like aldol condensation-catalyzing enzyme
MHLRGNDTMYKLIFPDGREQIVINMPCYDFKWQLGYDLTEPIKVSKGTKLVVIEHYNNSVKNKFNPDPNRTVYNGNMTWEEMFSRFFAITGLTATPKLVSRAAAVIACALVFLAGFPAFAQGYLNGVALNKKIVTDFYRLVFEPRNPDLIDRYIAPDFAEHNPAIQGGRDGLVEFMKTLPRSASDDVGTEMKNPPVYTVAEADLATFIFKQSTPDPSDKAKSYDRFTFDMFRLRNGKIVEHWDGAAK